jgi:TetR/AcrR family transcriptional regulator, fatty acid metabolism regulator protein
VRTKTPLQADKMLDAAARLFGHQRFHEVRMEDIAAEAAVGKGTIYRYFNDKEELYLALLARSSRQYVERLREKVVETEGARAQLEALVEHIIAFFDEQPHLLDLIQRAEVMRGPNTPWQQARDEVFRLTRDVFRAGEEQSEFAIRDAELASLMLLAGLRGILRFGKRPRARDLAKRIVDGFLQGYGRAFRCAKT